MTNTGFIIVLISFIAAVAAFLVGIWAPKKPGVMLTPAKPKKLCKGMHNWQRGHFVSYEQQDDCIAHPEKYPKQSFCVDCGFMPETKTMVDQKYLEDLRVQLEVAKLAQEKARIVEELKQVWLATYLQRNPNLTAGEILAVKIGYDLYDSFVEALPGMVKSQFLDGI